MFKLIIAYKAHDLFSVWDYIERKMHDIQSIEYLILRYRYNSNKPEFFKNSIFRTKDETKRKQAQSIDELEADAIIFVNEFDNLVKLRYQNQEMDLIEFKTEQEREKEKYDYFIEKFGHDTLIRSSEELEEFKQALDLFEKIGDFDNIEIVDYIRGFYTNASNFPILAIVNWSQSINQHGHEENHLHITLVDQNLGM